MMPVVLESVGAVIQRSEDVEPWSRGEREYLERASTQVGGAPEYSSMERGRPSDVYVRIVPDGAAPVLAVKETVSGY
jgi:hypothetical protein